MKKSQVWNRLVNMEMCGTYANGLMVPTTIAEFHKLEKGKKRVILTALRKKEDRRLAA